MKNLILKRLLKRSQDVVILSPHSLRSVQAPGEESRRKERSFASLRMTKTGFFSNFLNNKRAMTLLEYSVILGVILLAIGGLEIFVKRNMQGKIKDATDFFISPEQVGEITPTSRTDSISTGATTSTTDSRYSRGALSTAVSEESSRTYKSNTVDVGTNPRGAQGYSPSSIPAEEGYSLEPADYPDVDVGDRAETEEAARREINNRGIDAQQGNIDRLLERVRSPGGNPNSAVRQEGGSNE